MRGEKILCKESGKKMYYGIFSILMILSLIEVTKARSSISLVKRSKVHRIAFYLVVAFLVFFAGFRGRLGTDYNTYLRYFSSIKEGTATLGSVEPFYFLLGFITDSFEWFLLIIAMLSILIKSKYIYEESKYVFVSLIVYYSYMFLQFDMGIVRQGLALAFTLWAATYIKERKLGRYLALCFVAVMFHYSALIFIPAYFLAQKEYTRKTIYGISLISLILSFTDFWKVISYVLSMLSVFGLNKYSWYLTNEAFRASAFELMDLQRIVMLIFFTEYIKRKNDDEENKIYLNMYFISTALYYLFRTFSAISSRGSYYFTAFEILLFPSVLKNIKSPYKRVLVWAMIMLYCGIYLYKVINQYSVGDYYNLPYIPYNTWLIS